MPNNSKIAVSIVTYKRPDSLAATLRSLQQLALPADTAIKLIVIDNDEEQSALPVVDSIKGAMPFAVEYKVEARRGIPHARNAALMAAAESDYLAFIDDDDIADSQWLIALYGALRRYDADVVKGQVHYTFPVGKEYLKNLDIFPFLSHPTGSELDSAWTNNVLLSTRLYKDTGLRFDPAFTSIGGGDHYFFSCAKARGAKIIMCQEAIIRSVVPLQRCCLRYLSLRHIRMGATLTIADCKQYGYGYGLRKVIWAFSDSAPHAYRLLCRAVRRHIYLIRPVMVMLFLFGRVIGLFRLSPRGYR